MGYWSAFGVLEDRASVCWGFCIGLVAVADCLLGAVEENGELRFYVPGYGLGRLVF